MSRTLFRSKNIEPERPIPIYSVRQLQDRADFAHASRGLVTMPTGLEKEEETEAHLQAAMRAQAQFGETRDLVIPTPEFFRVVPISHFRRFKPPRIYLRQDLEVDAHSRYDADSDDDVFLRELEPEKLDVAAFEKMVEKLDVVMRTAQFESQNQDIAASVFATTNLPGETIGAVIAHWRAKRARLPSQFALVPQVKTEQTDGQKMHDPYVAFRKRFEKMQTRKNRKVEEANFEKLVMSYLNLVKLHQLLQSTHSRELLSLKLTKSFKSLFVARIVTDSKSRVFDSIIGSNLFPDLEALTTAGVNTAKSCILRNSPWRTTFPVKRPSNSSLLSLFLEFRNMRINSVLDVSSEPPESPPLNPEYKARVAELIAKPASGEESSDAPTV